MPNVHKIFSEMVPLHAVVGREAQLCWTHSIGWLYDEWLFVTTCVAGVVLGTDAHDSVFRVQPLPATASHCNVITSFVVRLSRSYE